MNQLSQLTLGICLIVGGTITSLAVLANSSNISDETVKKYETLHTVQCYTLQEMTDEQLELTAFKNDGMLIATDITGEGRILDLRDRLDAEAKKQAVDFTCNLHRPVENSETQPLSF